MGELFCSFSRFHILNVQKYLFIIVKNIQKNHSFSIGVYTRTCENITFYKLKTSYINWKSHVYTENLNKLKTVSTEYLYKLKTSCIN